MSSYKYHTLPEALGDPTGNVSDRQGGAEGGAPRPASSRISYSIFAKGKIQINTLGSDLPQRHKEKLWVWSFEKDT
ncbi:hypothetical protein RRG08_006007 [Elysia crispata]|uniref:Uncharacterized protein n=1 Tax=Elysia crispata TaxID=231223 RepID=A0AAE0XUI3_9GAST|nr:hypothetical protein RRG08_006007 [Elysia crispata]